jgi:pimeloyl-ACP methyl ester carboxylesterase
MTSYTLQDFGGCFLTTEGVKVNDKKYPGICAYVEWFIPENACDLSITLVHGGGGQGSEYLRTPDNRPGWVHAFLSAGYSVYVLDRPGHGRCHWNESILGPSMDAPNYELLYPRFVEPVKHELWPEASMHSQWPEATESQLVCAQMLCSYT